MGTKIGEQLHSVFVKCATAFTMDGNIITPGAIVELLEDDAKPLLARGMAVLATIEHAIEAGLVDAGVLAQDGDDAAATAPEPADSGAAPADAAAAPSTDAQQA